MPEKTQIEPVKRFSNRAEKYLKYRPKYPKDVLVSLIRDTGLTPKQIIADIGSGTGFLAELFLNYGNLVYGVEPNPDMRHTGENYLSDYSNFRSIDGTAEDSTLAPNSVDYITAGQAFHWFDRSKAKVEFNRVLRSHGYVVLVWNMRKIDDPFMGAYESLLDEISVGDIRVTEIHRKQRELNMIADFYGSGGFREYVFSNHQHFDFKGLRGRFLSSSYAPLKGDPRYPRAMKRLQRLFGRFQVQGSIKFSYETMMFVGQLD